MVSNNPTARRVALVTGGSRGIGAAIAIRLAQDHAAVAFTYRQRRDEADEVAGRIESLGCQALALQCDLGDARAGREAVNQVADRFGSVDSLVNNAGEARRRSLSQLSIEEWSAALMVNLTAAFVTVQAAVPHMRRAGSGAIVNIGSPVGQTGGIVGAHYSAAKAGLVGLTMQAARELTEYRIRVNLVEPAGVDTEMVRCLLDDDPDLKIVARIGRRGSPAEVAAVVAFLCSKEASFVSGSTVAVTGGGT